MPSSLLIRLSVIVVVTLGCSRPSEPSELDSDRQTFARPYLSGLPNTGPCGGNPQPPGVDHTCNAGVAFVGVELASTAPQGASGDLDAAIGRWNRLLREAAGPGGSKVIEISPGTTIYVNATSRNGLFCGEATSGSGRADRVDVWPAPHSRCVGRQTGSLVTILTHELSHVLGWDGSHGGDQARNSPLTNVGCTTFLPKLEEGAAISGNVCYHDVEAILRAQIDQEAMSTATYFTQPILSGTNVSRLVFEIPRGTTTNVALTG